MWIFYLNLISKIIPIDGFIASVGVRLPHLSFLSFRPSLNEIVVKCSFDFFDCFYSNGFKTFGLFETNSNHCSQFTKEQIPSDVTLENENSFCQFYLKTADFSLITSCSRRLMLTFLLCSTLSCRYVCVNRSI